MKITVTGASSMNLIGPHLFLGCRALMEHNLIHKLPSSRCVDGFSFCRFESHSPLELGASGEKGGEDCVASGAGTLFLGEENEEGRGGGLGRAGSHFSRGHVWYQL